MLNHTLYMQCRGRGLLFADDAAVIANGEECMQRIAYEKGVMFWRRKLKVNVNRSSYENIEIGEHDE